MNLTPFAFLATAELDALAPICITQLPVRVTYLGNEAFQVPDNRSGSEFFDAIGATLETAGSYSFEDAHGWLHEIHVTAEQQRVLLRAAHALGAPASYVLAYVAGITAIHPVFYDINTDIICSASA